MLSPTDGFFWWTFRHPARNWLRPLILEVYLTGSRPISSPRRSQAIPSNPPDFIAYEFHVLENGPDPQAPLDRQRNRTEIGTVGEKKRLAPKQVVGILERSAKRKTIPADQARDNSWPRSPALPPSPWRRPISGPARTRLVVSKGRKNSYSDLNRCPHPSKKSASLSHPRW